MHTYSFEPIMDFYDWNYGDFDSLFMKTCESLVLDDEKGELVNIAQSDAINEKNGLDFDEKALANLKSHSEAEKRRRQRINGHLDTLRALVPCNDKMDKATLLAEVIRHVKQLKQTATQAGLGLLMPEDIDQLKIQKFHHSINGDTTTFRATFCCKHRPELLADVRRALADLKVNLKTAELSTLGDHVKIIFNFNADEKLLGAVRGALTSVIEQGSMSLEYTPRSMLANKRRKYCL